MPVWLQWVGAILMLVGMWVAWLALRENKYGAAVVRIQEERGQHVIDTGVYAIVRHPMYVGGLIFLIGMGLILGSWCAFVGGLVVCAILLVRTALEDRTLQRDLAGYVDYAKRVRYRLIPSVW
ncbi:MAG: isoprenylcysteine carboxylmethyltransferase family protein [Candidatus Eremiobacteraeota bacterium]|nr:isoprenylcysteine carboxylmethyltransferase family protein [Candidatus Eremiobacteraeota bacterium]